MTKARRGPIVIALDALDARDVAVEIARHLRREADQELLGVFVEDTYVLNHARSRLAREIMLSGAERPLHGGVLERQIRARSSRVRQRFEAAVSAAGVRASFRIERGDLLEALGEQAREAEALVLSLSRASTRLNELLEAAIDRCGDVHLPLLLLAREGWLKGDSVLVLVTDWDAGEAALQLAARIAAASASPLRIAVAGDALARGGDLGAQAAARLTGSPAELVGVAPLGTLNPGALAHAARAGAARLVIVPSGRGVDRVLVAALSRRLTSALMLVDTAPR